MFENYRTVFFATFLFSDVVFMFYLLHTMVIKRRHVPSRILIGSAIVLALLAWGAGIMFDVYVWGGYVLLLSVVKIIKFINLYKKVRSKRMPL